MTVITLSSIRTLLTYPAADFRKHLSEIAILVGYKNRSVGLRYRGKLLAVLIPAALFELCEELTKNPSDTAVQNEIIAQIAQRMHQAKE